MASQTLTGPNGWQRHFTHAELSQIALSLTASSQSWQQLEDEVVVFRLDGLGRILLMKVSWFPNRRVFETHVPSYDSTLPYAIRWTLTGSLSSYVNTAQMFVDLGFTSLTISSLANVYMMYFENLPARSKFTAVDASINEYQLLCKNYTTNNTA